MCNIALKDVYKWLPKVAKSNMLLSNVEAKVQSFIQPNSKKQGGILLNVKINGLAPQIESLAGLQAKKWRQSIYYG